MQGRHADKCTLYKATSDYCCHGQNARRSQLPDAAPARRVQNHQHQARETGGRRSRPGLEDQPPRAQ